MEAGSILVTLQGSGRRISQVRIAARRPMLAPLFAGRGAAEVPGLIRLCFAVCAAAQGAAADAALAAAESRTSGDALGVPIVAEAAAELALAVFAGMSGGLAAAARRAAAVPEALFELLDRQWLGIGVQDWLSLNSLQALGSWARAVDAPLAREARRRLQCLEPPGSPALALSIADAAQSVREWPRLGSHFAAFPLYRDAPAETGAVARLAGEALLVALRRRPLLQRWCARLTELLWYATRNPALRVGRLSALDLGGGRGRAMVETARGTLLHELALQDGRVASYVVVAPTEWNFHPQGTLHRWLNGLTFDSPDALLGLAQRAVAALDPCVDCRCVLAGIDNPLMPD